MYAIKKNLSILLKINFLFKVIGNVLTPVWKSRVTSMAKSVLILKQNEIDMCMP